MAKAAVHFACTECGYSSGRWFGKCPGCGAFGTLVEEAPAGGAHDGRGRQAAPAPRRRRGRGGGADPDRRARARPRARRRARPGLARARRRRAGRRQVDAAAHARSARSPQRPARAARHRRGVGRAGEAPRRRGSAAPSSVEILAETELDAVCATLERERPDVCVIDSVQTLYAAEHRLRARARSARCARRPARLLRVAKESGVAIFLVGHVTKDGAVAGPRVLEHLVDCVLQFEGDRYRAHRILRAAKNRFGSTNELGVFEMTGDGPRRRARSLGALRPERCRARSARPSPARSRGRGRSCSRSRRSSRRPTSRCRAASAPASTRSGSR